MVVAFISYLSPNNAKFKYQFEQGQSWRYEDLMAPFDFAIKKTEDQLNLEFEELTGEFSPYYEMDLSVVKRKKNAFLNSFNEQLNIAKRDEQFPDVILKPGKYSNYGIQLIEKIYEEGVVELDPIHQDKGKDFVLNIVKGNTTQPKTLQNLQSAELATEFLSDSLPYLPLAEPDFLLPLLENLISPNVKFNDTLTTKIRRSQLEAVSEFDGMVRKGELIIPKDGIVTADIYQKLISFREQYEREISSKKSYLGVFGGYFLLTSLIVGVFLIFLQVHYQKLYGRFLEVFFMLIWLVIYSYLVYAVEAADSLSAYLIPFCIVPIVVKIFYNERLALFTHIVVVLIASFLSSLDYEFTFLQILAGIVAVLTPFDTRNWSRFFFSMLFIFLTYALGYLGLSLIEEGSLRSVEWRIYQWLFLNVLLTLLAYPLIPLIERLFGFTSNVTLVELSDMNRPLLKELSLKAPGTFQHSLQVGNLSEAAADLIGANSLLVKVAALYHDIGKTLRPEYFIENQTGETSPHQEINNFESARIIIDHVTEGVKMAKKSGLPEIIIDFIKTHHGTTRVEYFYRNQLQEFPDQEFDESLFRYPGPKPRSREEAILMLADSLEAAAKSLKNPTGLDIDELVEKIIQGKIAKGQLEESALSFQDLESCKQVFKKLLRSINHVRIEYPEEMKGKIG